MSPTPQSPAFTAMNSARELSSHRYNPRPSRYSTTADSVVVDNTPSLGNILAETDIEPQALHKHYNQPQHQQHQHQQSQQVYLCDDCGTSFPSYPELKAHIKDRAACRGNDGEEEEEEEENKNYKIIRGKAGRWLCKLCGKDYSSKGNLQRHQENLHDVIDGDIDKAEILSDSTIRVPMIRGASPMSNVSAASVRVERRGRKRKRPETPADVVGGDNAAEADDKSVEDEFEDARGTREDSVLLSTPPPQPQLVHTAPQVLENGGFIEHRGDGNNEDAAMSGTAADERDIPGDASNGTAVPAAIATASATHLPADSQASLEQAILQTHADDDDDDDDSSITNLILNAHANSVNGASKVSSAPSRRGSLGPPTAGAFQPQTVNQQIFQMGRENRTLRYRIDQYLREIAALKDERKRMGNEVKRLKTNNRCLLQMVNEYAKAEDGY